MSRERLEASQLSFDEATEAWETLSEYVARFLEAWETGDDPPEIAEYLPDEPAALRRLVLIELIKVDLEQRVQGRGQRREIETYGEEFPELLGEAGLPCDLIYEEYHARHQAGEAVSYQEYLDRFPEQARSLRRLFGFRSTRVVKRQMAGPAAISVRRGEHIEDFEVLDSLGEGAFAKVFLAHQKSMQRRVALKISARESDEPQTMAQLDHANIVRVFDQRHLADRDMQLVYMEYVPGGSLHQVVEKVRRTPAGSRSGRLLLEVVDQALGARGESPPFSLGREHLAQMSWGETVCWIGAQLAAALDYAHARQTLHRDLKPANVLLSPEGVPKLVDFNMAFSSKLEGASPAAYFGGSVGYMAPEHLEAYSPHHERRPDELDGRADLYSLGLVLWELLTGSRPFADELIDGDWAATIREMIERRRDGVLPSVIDQLPRDLPPGLREALLRCLAPDPEKRFANGGDMARELGLCLNPEICRARQRRSRSWCQTMRRHPIVTASLVGVLPNFAISVANVSYDWFAIVAPRLPEAVHAQFFTLITLFKAAFYVLGLIAGLAVAMPALRPFWMQASGPALAAARRRCLALGDLVFWVSIAAWGASGILFPAWLDWSSRGIPEAGSLQLAEYFHFLAAHLLCGLIAGTLGFFVMGLVVVRVLYPGLLEMGTPEPNADQPLLALRNRLTNFTRLAVVVPFLAAVTLGFGDPGFQPAFAGLAILGLAVLAGTFRLLRETQVDLDALIAAVSPQITLFGASTSRWPG